VFQTAWFAIEELSESFSTSEPYYRLTCDESVEICATTSDGKIILVRQHRPAIGLSMLELPAGHINAGESPRAAARRELLEETGMRCDSLRYLGPFRIANDRINSRLHVFAGRGAKPARRRAAKTAEKGIEVVLVPEKKFIRLILSGGFTGLPGIGAYFLSKLGLKAKS
jgi:8-oxo-dGTP pyrophosphatase MutT (NUDIX family)